MKAWILPKNGTIDDIALGELDKPTAGSGEILVRVMAAAVNPADVKVISGRDGGGFLHAKNFPFAIGFDFSGEVEAVGANASVYQPGDQVFGFLPYSSKNRQGSFAEYVVVSEDSVGRKPASLAHTDAASVATAGSTALQGLRDEAGLAAGQRVLINGASGGVGSYAVQLAKHEGAEVWGTCSASNVDFVTGLGADRVVDYRSTPLADIGAADDGGARTRFDIVYDAASVSSYAACTPLLTGKGTYLTLLPSLSWATGKMRALFSGRSCKFVIVKGLRADLDHLAALIEGGSLTVHVAETYGIADLPTALRRLADGKVQGKVAVTVDFAA